jgi:ATP-dependent Clp protease ATP-binding subunit ClpA
MATPDPKWFIDLPDRVKEMLVGQDHAVNAIIPTIQVFSANISPNGRPAGVFLLAGPTGTGKTKTVEAVAKALHGSERHLVRVDCGEFQQDHEVAKLIGSPPGYLGHKETQPIFTQAKLASVTTEASSLSIVLFDEIEKAAPALTRLMLGILDKATLRLGDNNIVAFDRTLIFLTSNLGAKAMANLVTPSIGFGVANEQKDIPFDQLKTIAVNAVKKHFSPEFVNRLDEVVVYQPLTKENIREILRLEVDRLRVHLAERLGRIFGFSLHVTAAAEELLIELGFSREYGARELKRVLFKKLTVPIAAMILAKKIKPGSVVTLAVSNGEFIYRTMSKKVA